MENSNKRVFYLTLICFSLYLYTSIIFEVFNLHWKPFDRVNLISEIFHKKGEKESAADTPKIVVNEKPQQDFELYKKPNLITNFYQGNSFPLPQFLEKLKKLKNGENVKIRIAYFGDSMIEGDLLTQTFRKLLQGEYGGSGVGFLPITSNVAGFRQTATCSANGWEDTSFKTKGATNLYLSGHIFTGNGSGSYTDNTIKQPNISVQKNLIYGKPKGSENTITANGREISLSGTEDVNRQVLLNDANYSLKIKNNSGETPIYGVSFESEKGIFVDNFSFRGITGAELNKLNEDFLQSVEKANHYDLIIFQYGVNLLFRPNDTDYTYYEKLISPVFAKFKKSFPDSDFLLVSAADRAFRYEGTYQSAKGLPNLLEMQAKIALDNNFAFYNQFATMGGTNSIVKWAEEKPSLANKDYVHPNGKGADILGEKLFNAVQNEFKKYNKKK